jgi:hypothetical protein
MADRRGGGGGSGREHYSFRALGIIFTTQSHTIHNPLFSQLQISILSSPVYQTLNVNYS